VSDVIANDHESRIRVLEHIARSTDATLLRIETRLDRIDSRIAEDFRFLVRLHIGQFAALAAGFVLLLGVIARAQHWI
jgi:hypothetical protein